MLDNNDIEEVESLEVKDVFLSKLYNREYKELFLKEYLEKDSTRESYTIYLMLIAETERMLGKDLFLFSAQDIINYFANAYTTSHTALRSAFSIFKNYVNWGVGRGFNNATGVNPFSTISFKKDILPLLNVKNMKSRFITEEQMWDIENLVVNYQDYVCLVLPFYLAKGEKCKELVNLTDSRVNGITNTLTLIDNSGEVREMVISQRVMEVVVKAGGEDVYRRESSDEKEGSIADLQESEYIIRSTRRSDSGSANAQAISARCKRLLIEAGYEDMSIQDVKMSGKLALLKRMEIENGGTLVVEDFQEVNRLAGDNDKNYNNLRETYNLYETAITKVD